MMLWGGTAKDGDEAPNSNFQAPEKYQTPITQPRTESRSIEVWFLVFIGILELGAWMFSLLVRHFDQIAVA